MDFAITRRTPTPPPTPPSPQATFPIVPDIPEASPNPITPEELADIFPDVAGDPSTCNVPNYIDQKRHSHQFFPSLPYSWKRLRPIDRGCLGPVQRGVQGGTQPGKDQRDQQQGPTTFLAGSTNLPVGRLLLRGP